MRECADLAATAIRGEFLHQLNKLTCNNMSCRYLDDTCLALLDSPRVQRSSKCTSNGWDARSPSSLALHGHNRQRQDIRTTISRCKFNSFPFHCIRADSLHATISKSTRRALVGKCCATGTVMPQVTALVLPQPAVRSIM